MRAFILLAAAAAAAGCSNVADPGIDDTRPLTTFAGAAASTCGNAIPRSVLIDPTHDGGTWWFPQSSNFRSDQPHQGKAFADYLRSRGYAVTELGRGQTMAPDSMMKYAVIVRAGYYADPNHPGYSADDLAAYAAYTGCSRTLVILAEYFRNGRRDDLTEAFGIPLVGNVTGRIESFVAHELTAGVTSISYIAGSYLDNESSAAIQVLGRVGAQAVMGLLTGRAAKILFLGDVNGIQTMPQPFVDNLLAWGF